MSTEAASNEEKYHPIVLLGGVIGFAIGTISVYALPRPSLTTVMVGGVLGALGAGLGAAGARMVLAAFAKKEAANSGGSHAGPPPTRADSAEQFPADEELIILQPLALATAEAPRRHSRPPLDRFDKTAIALTAAFLYLLTLCSQIMALLPALATAPIMATIYLAVPKKYRPLAPAFSVLAGHAAFMCLVVLIGGLRLTNIAGLNVEGIDLIVVPLGLVALAIWPDLLTVGLITVYQVVALGAVLCSYLAVAGGSHDEIAISKRETLLVYLALRAYSLLWLWCGWQRMMRQQPANDNTIDDDELVVLPEEATTDDNSVQVEVVQPLPGAHAALRPAKRCFGFAVAAVVLAVAGASGQSIVASAPSPATVSTLTCILLAVLARAVTLAKIGSLLAVLASAVYLSVFHRRNVDRQSRAATVLARAGVVGNIAALFISAFFR